MCLLRAHKTAGQSFGIGIRSAIRSSEVAPYNFSWQLTDLGPEDLRPFRYLSGHIGRPSAERVVPEARLVTILRDPVKRLISSYFYWRSQVERVPEANHHDVAVRLQSMSLLDYVRSEEPEIRRATNNVQARLLAGADYGLEPGTRSQLFGCEDPPDILAERALAGMERFVVVGVVERFADSLTAVYRALDIPGRPKIEHDNRTPSQFKDQQVTDEVLAHARRLSEADQVVYDTAKASFSDQASGAADGRGDQARTT